MINNFVLSHIGLPLAEKVSRTRSWSLYKNLLALQKDDARVAGQYQLKRLSELLIHAHKTTPHWISTIAAANVSGTAIGANNASALLRFLPLSTKQTYAQGFPDQVTNALSKDSWQYLSSAGTTGRMTVVTDFNKRDYLRAAEHLNLYCAVNQATGLRTIDIPPNACNVVCGFADAGPEPLLSFLFWHVKKKTLFQPECLSDARGRIERQIILNRKTLLPIEPAPWSSLALQLDRIIEQIKRDKIRIVRALPHYLLWLATRITEKHIVLPHVKAVIPYGGLTSESMIRRIKKAFGAEFINAYGTGEVGAIGCSDTAGDTISAYLGMAYIEIIDDKGLPVKVGESGRLVVTDLNNFAMPILRYDIGDAATLVELNAESNSVSKFKLLGRSQESFKAQSNRMVFARDIQNLFFSFDSITNFKLEQITAENFRVSVSSTGEFDLEKLKSKLQILLELTKEIPIKIVPFILPESSGKYLSIKLKHKKNIQKEIGVC